jgi:hypothetical protein
MPNLEVAFSWKHLPQIHADIFSLATINWGLLLRHAAQRAASNE